MVAYFARTLPIPDDHTWAEEIVATLEIPGLSGGGVDMAADSWGSNYWDEVQLVDGVFCGVRWNETLQAYRLVSLPVSELLQGCGYTADLCRGFELYGRDLRDPVNSGYDMGRAASQCPAVMHIAPPWVARLVQAPETDPAYENGDGGLAYRHETGDSLFCCDVRNLTSGKTTLQLVRARVYRVQIQANHHNYSPLYRFRTPRVPPIALPFTVSTASGDIDLICVWHMAEYTSIDAHALMVPHVFLAALDDSSYLVDCPITNCVRDVGTYQTGLVTTVVAPGCYSSMHRAYECHAYSYEQGYALRERPIGDTYDNRGTDDRRVILEIVDLVEWDTETWVQSWSAKVTRGANYVVGGTNDVVAEFSSGLFTRKRLAGPVKGFEDIPVWTLEVTVDDLGIDPDDFWDDLHLNVVYINEDDEEAMDASGAEITRRTIWPLADLEHPCPFSARRVASIADSQTRCGRWWPDAEPTQPWADNTSSIAITVAEDHDSIDIDIIADWSAVGADIDTYYRSYLRVIDSTGRRLYRKQLTSYYEDYPPNPSRPVTNTTVTIDTSHHPDTVMVEVYVTIYNTADPKPQRYVTRKRALIGEP